LKIGGQVPELEWLWGEAKLGVFGQVSWWFVQHEPYFITFMTCNRTGRASVLSAFCNRARTNASRPAIGMVVKAFRSPIEVEQ